MTIARLRSVILAGLAQKCSQQELFDELMAHKQQLLKIFDVGNRDPQQQKELESGMCQPQVSVSIHIHRQNRDKWQVGCSKCRVCPSGHLSLPATRMFRTICCWNSSRYHVREPQHWTSKRPRTRSSRIPPTTAPLGRLTPLNSQSLQAHRSF